MIAKSDYYMSLEEMNSLPPDERSRVPLGRLILPNLLIGGDKKANRIRCSRIDKAQTFEEARQVLIHYCLYTMEEGLCIRKMLDLANAPAEYYLLHKCFAMHFYEEDFIRYNRICIEAINQADGDLEKLSEIAWNCAIGSEADKLVTLKLSMMPP